MLLGVVSMFLVHPDSQYPSIWITGRWHFIFLMTIMEGFKQTGLFRGDCAGSAYESSYVPQLYLVLVLLVFLLFHVDYK